MNYDPQADHAATSELMDIIMRYLNDESTKLTQIEKLITEASSAIEAESHWQDWNSNGYYLTYLTESSERFIGISIASLYERTLRAYFDHFEQENICKALKETNLYKTVQDRLKELRVWVFFGELESVWQVLLQCRNYLAHNNVMKSSKRKRFSKLLHDSNLGHLVKIDISTGRVDIQDEFYVLCLNCYMDLANKLSVIGDCFLPFENIAFNDLEEFKYEKLVTTLSKKMEAESITV